ncbi:MAG TPA: DUF4382 domain-containing protein [Gemmatimonadaceae bacterium]|nr:DUF4382 domain-containing protein [Gemmatimonadaceae bacterium]
MSPRTALSALALAGLAAGALTLAACSDDRSPTAGGTGSTRVLLTDAPFPYDSVERVDVYVVSIAASAALDTSGAGPGWVTIATPRKRFNLLDLQQGTTALVGAGELPAGAYRAVRMVIDTDSSGVWLRGGREARVHWPAPGEIALHALVEAPVAVPDEGTDIVIDFDVGRSFSYWGGDELTFLPWIRAVNEAATGAIAGTVLGDPQGDGSMEPLANASISVYPRTNDLRLLAGPVSTGRTDAQGRYHVAFLLPGDYDVTVETPGLYQVGTSAATVPVSARDTTTHDVTLPAADHSYVVVEGSFLVPVGGATTLHAIVGDAQGRPIAGAPVQWSSADPAVASLVANGAYATVTGVANGSALVTASSGGRSDSVRIYVGPVPPDSVIVPPDPPVASLALTPAALTISLRDSIAALTATARDSAGNELRNTPVSFLTSDSTVALVFSNGRSAAWVLALKPGTATITAFAGSERATAGVTVVP